MAKDPTWGGKAGEIDAIVYGKKSWKTQKIAGKQRIHHFPQFRAYSPIDFFGLDALPLVLATIDPEPMERLRAQAGGKEDATASRALRRFQAQSRELARFTAVPTNLPALEAALLFGHGLNPLLALSGAAGWGKTHLLRVASEAHQLESGQMARVRSASQYLVRRGRWDIPGPLILDDAQLCLSRPRERQALRNALELRIRLGRPTLIAISGEMQRLALPSTHRWTKVTLASPDRTERQVILRQMASEEGVQLGDRLISILSRLLAGNGHSLRGAIQRLGLMGERFSGFQAECLALGIVAPYLNSDRELAKMIDRSVSGTTEPLGLDLCPDLSRCVSVHMMRRLFELPEESIAEFYGIQPGEVFSHEQVFDQALLDVKVGRLYAICLEALDQSFGLI